MDLSLQILNKINWNKLLIKDTSICYGKSYGKSYGNDLLRNIDYGNTKVLCKVKFPFIIQKNNISQSKLVYYVFIAVILHAE